MKEEDLRARKSNYSTVSVIGCQSSGKSTLLNILFDTDFTTLNQEEDGQ
jgi:protein SEY1